MQRHWLGATAGMRETFKEEKTRDPAIRSAPEEKIFGIMLTGLQSIVQYILALEQSYRN